MLASLIHIERSSRQSGSLGFGYPIRRPAIPSGTEKPDIPLDCPPRELSDGDGLAGSATYQEGQTLLNKQLRLHESLARGNERERPGRQEAGAKVRSQRPRVDPIGPGQTDRSGQVKGRCEQPDALVGLQLEQPMDLLHLLRRIPTSDLDDRLLRDPQFGPDAGGRGRRIHRLAGRPAMQLAGGHQSSDLSLLVESSGQHDPLTEVAQPNVSVSVRHRAAPQDDQYVVGGFRPGINVGEASLQQPQKPLTGQWRCRRSSRRATAQAPGCRSGAG